jgi:hypothetical protein
MTGSSKTLETSCILLRKIELGKTSTIILSIRLRCVRFKVCADHYISTEQDDSTVLLFTLAGEAIFWARTAYI